MFKFEELHVYQQAMSLSKEMYALTKYWPPEEKFGLTSQLRRASVSIALNIAEGSSRSSSKEFQHFLDMARGSCYECFTILGIAQSQSLITQQESENLNQQLNKLSSMISALKIAITHKTSPKAA